MDNRIGKNENFDNNIEDTLKLLRSKERVEIPKSLLPENIEEKLKSVEGTKDYRKRKKRITSAAVWKKGLIAAAALLVIAAAAVKAPDTVKDFKASYAINKAVTGQGSSISDREEAKARYKAAYKMLASQREESYDTDNKTFIFENEANEDFAVKKSKAEDESMSVNASEESSDTEKYSDTNVRTEGVSESDIVKTDGRYIYEYSSDSEHINIYEVLENETKPAGDINLNPYNMYVNPEGFYIYNDVLVVLGSSTSRGGTTSKKGYSDNEIEAVAEGEMDDYYEYWNSEENGAREYYTRALLFDISDKENITLIHGFFQDGSYADSRVVGGVLYLFSRRGIDVNYIDEENTETYIPKIQGKLLEGTKLAVAEDSGSNAYQVISSISLNDAEYIDKLSVLGGNEKLYVSDSHIYLLDTVHRRGDTANQARYILDDVAVNETETSIISYSYKDGVMKREAKGNAAGCLLNDYCIDEYNGYLRLVSTYYNNEYERLNGLFVLNKDLKQVGCIKNLARKESIYSARFMGNTAYFVTYLNHDPLFAVDLSNPEKPKMLGYLKIPGFSSYLHPYGEGLLLGIGKETTEKESRTIGLKLSMFDISDPANVKEVDKVILKKYNTAEALDNPKALLVDMEKNLIGMQMEYNPWLWDAEEENERSDYVVYSYDKNKGFERKLTAAWPEDEKYESEASYEQDSGYYYSLRQSRGLYIGDTLYVVNVGKNISAFDIASFRLKYVTNAE